MPIETSVAGVTVSAVEPLTGPEAALMVVVPGATLVARPFEPEALLTVAADVSEDAHVADAVRSWVEPSVYIPVVVSCSWIPAAIERLDGVTTMERSDLPGR